MVRDGRALTSSGSSSSASRNAFSGSNPSRFQRLLGLTSALVSRISLATRAGLSYGGLRDMYAACGYKRTLTATDYRERYERDGIAERLVELLPGEIWGRNISIYEGENPKVQAPFEIDINNIIKKLNLFAEFRRADILARLGHYGVIILGVEGESNSPITRLSGPDSLKFLLPLSEEDAKIDKQDLEKNKNSDRYGQPVYYTINTEADRRSVKYHYTRIIHFAHGLLSSRVYGKPYLRSIWNNIDNVNKVEGSGAEASWQRANPGIHMKKQLDLPENVLIEGEEDELEAQWDEYVHSQRRIMESAGYDVDILSTNPFNYGSNIDIELHLIAGAKAIPQRIIFGSERGEQASTQDRNNFNDRVRAEIRDSCEPALRQFIDRLIEFGGVRAPANEYKIQWGDEDSMSEVEKVTSVKEITTANLNQKKATGEIVVTSAEMRERYFKMKPLTVQQENESDKEEIDEIEKEETDPDTLKTDTL